MSDPYDVVIFKIEDGMIDTIAGKGLNLDKGFYNAEKRLETVEQRLNEHYNAAIVTAGKYKKGDFLKPEDKK